MLLKQTNLTKDLWHHLKKTLGLVLVCQRFDRVLRGCNGMHISWEAENKRTLLPSKCKLFCWCFTIFLSSVNVVEYVSSYFTEKWLVFFVLWIQTWPTEATQELLPTPLQLFPCVKAQCEFVADKLLWKPCQVDNFMLLAAAMDQLGQRALELAPSWKHLWDFGCLLYITPEGHPT